MPKLQIYQTGEEQINKTITNLSSYLSKKNNLNQIKKFLENILTESEMIMVARRIQIADMLINGFTHEEIIKQLKVGETTINKVNSTLKKFLSKEKVRKKVFDYNKEAKAAYGTFDHLRKTYKGYFALINAIID